VAELKGFQAELSPGKKVHPFSEFDCKQILIGFSVNALRLGLTFLTSVFTETIPRIISGQYVLVSTLYCLRELDRPYA
jgi:hypothetical protein